jgi:NAD-dependent deacetylase
LAFADHDDVARLRDMIAAAESVVIFTGAGISTESGIPDFRSPGGLWTKYQPIDFGDFMASEEMRRESWRRKFAMDPAMTAAVPNRGHRAVAHLVDTDKVSAVITQNIDGLHQASGIPDMQVIELHGNATYAKCLTCGLRHELAPIKAAFLADETMPVCTGCGSEYMKTATISFGQSMPEEQMARAQRETMVCDLFIAIGSSLVVYPAAGFPVMAKQNGAGMVILNREPTDLDRHADLVINGEIGPTLGDAVVVN